MTGDWQMALEEFCSNQGWSMPVYTIKSSTTYHFCKVSVGGEAFRGQISSTCEQARENAAFEAYNRLRVTV
ncbi:hypothetical protein HI914_06722 [Erysiphe necator]|nr:hypothetical protein HI914_06722 [Erysiphe necator]